MIDYGSLALVPPLVVIVLAIILKTSFEPLLLGSLSGFVIIWLKEGKNFFTAFVNSLLSVIGDPSSGGAVWVIMVCGLYGSLIGLMVRSGGTLKFGEWALERIKTKRGALMGAWGLGLGIFLDDYLSALTVGLSMRKITDAFKIPREKLAYIVNATAPPWCVVVPISTWTIYVGSVLEKSNVAKAGQGLSMYWRMIPYVCYGYVAVLIIPLFIYGVLPWFGRMKAADVRAATTGELTPGKLMVTAALVITPMNAAKKPKIIYFLLPMVVLLVATVYFEIDALKGVMIAVFFTFVYYQFIRLGSFSQLSETVFSGFNSMVYALAILMMSYVLKDLNDKMGLTRFVLHTVTPHVNKQVLPLIVFSALGFISFTTGSSWGLYAVAIPLVVPLAESLHANVLLNCGAVVSAGVFGANACLYSDATVLTGQSTEISNMEHGLSQLPYACIAFGISCVLYLSLGYAMA